MKKSRIVIILIIALIVIGCICFIKYDNAQKQTICMLEMNINELNEKINSMQSNDKYSDKAFNYLAIGNSVTKHRICDYWWNEIGVAATSSEKDYFHLVSKYLKETYDDVNSYAYNYVAWEVQYTDRAETFEVLDPWLDSNLDLITIQLSENVTDFTTFEADYKELIKYIKSNCPKAKILILDDVWYEEKSEIKKKIADECMVEFVDLKTIREDESYLSSVGSTVYDSNGNEHIIDNGMVAKHPGDKGMSYIAEEIIKKIEE